MRKRSIAGVLVSLTLLVILGSLPAFAGSDRGADQEKNTVLNGLNGYETRNGFSNDGAYRPRFAPFRTLFSNLIGYRGHQPNGFGPTGTIAPKSSETRNLGVGGCWGWRGCRISR